MATNTRYIVLGLRKQPWPAGGAKPASQLLTALLSMIVAIVMLIQTAGASALPADETLTTPLRSPVGKSVFDSAIPLNRAPTPTAISLSEPTELDGYGQPRGFRSAGIDRLSNIATRASFIETLSTNKIQLVEDFHVYRSQVQLMPALFNQLMGGIPQWITFPQVPAQVYSIHRQIKLQAYATSGLPILYRTSTPNVCFPFATIALMFSPGKCTITALQPGNSNFQAATPVTRSFTIAKTPQLITFAPVPSQIYHPSKKLNLRATSSSYLNVHLTSLTPNTCRTGFLTEVSMVGVGTCTVKALQPGNFYYQAAPPVIRSFRIEKANQTIFFVQPPPQTLKADTRFDLFVRSSSNREVKLTSQTPSTCLSRSFTVYLWGPGTCTITATLAGNNFYHPAESVTRSFQVSAALLPEVSALSASGQLNNQNFASLAPFGNLVVMAYGSQSTATGQFGILRQHLAPNGAPRGLPIEVAAPAAGVGSPDVAALTSGYVIVWQGPDGSSTGIFAQRFTQSGAKTGPVIQINDDTVGAQSRPRVTALPDGAFAVVWQTAVSATDDDVWLRIFSATNTPLTGDVRVNTTTEGKQNNPDIAALQIGTIAVTFASETTTNRFSVQHRLFRSSGLPLTPQTTTAELNQVLNPTPVIAARLNYGLSGGFAVAYAQSEVASLASPADIYVRAFSQGGVLSPTSVQANTVTAGHQAAPAIASQWTGSFAVAYTTPDGAGTGIAMRLFLGNAVPQGSEERVNSVTALAQTAPALTPVVLPGLWRGLTYLTAWTTQSAIAANGNDIAARLFRGR